MQTGKFLSRGLLFVFGFYWIRKTIRSNDAEGKVNNEVSFAAISALDLIRCYDPCVIVEV